MNKDGEQGVCSGVIQKFGVVHAPIFYYTKAELEQRRLSPAANFDN